MAGHLLRVRNKFLLPLASAYYRWLQLITAGFSLLPLASASG